MKTYKHLRLGKFGIDIGWFPGEEWVLFRINLVEILADYPTGFSSVELFRLGLLRFIFSITIDLT